MTEERYRQLSAEIRGKLQKSIRFLRRKKKSQKQNLRKRKKAGKIYSIQ